MLELKRRLARLLVEKSYREGDFVLASGRRSDYYFDCRVTALHAEGAWLIGTLFNDMLKGLDIKGVGGMTMGADPLVSATTVISHEQGRPLHGLLVRKEAKGHGTGQFVEGLGNFSAGDSVAMLEDVVTTGGSLLKACDRVRAADLSIAAVCAILDRERRGTVPQEAGYDSLALSRKELVDLTPAEAGAGLPAAPLLLRRSSRVHVQVAGGAGAVLGPRRRNGCSGLCRQLAGQPV